MKTSLAYACIALVALGFVPACLTVSDDEGPTLSIEIFWDDETSSEDFQGEDCFGAQVDRMRWALWIGSQEPCRASEEAAGTCRDANPETDGVESFELWVSDEDNCRNAVDVIDAAPGTYELDLTGLDEDGVELWQATCSGLTVLRFDVAYECDVPAP